MANRSYLNDSFHYEGSPGVAPLLTPSGSRLNVTTSGGTSTSEAALPTGSEGVRISATEACWIRFGNTGLGAAAADSASMYFAAGVELMGIPRDADGVCYTHVRVIKAGSNETVVQFEKLA